jgi:hypothetical protein
MPILHSDHCQPETATSLSGIPTLVCFPALVHLKSPSLGSVQLFQLPHAQQHHVASALFLGTVKRSKALPCIATGHCTNHCTACLDAQTSH